MKLFRFSLLSLFLSIGAVCAYGQFPQAWSTLKDTGVPSTETPVRIFNASGGGFYVVGNADVEVEVVLRLDPSGAVLWTHYQYGRVLDAAANSTGLVVLSGGAGLRATKYSDSGQQLWSKLAFVDENDGDQTFLVGMDPAGNVVVATTLKFVGSSKAHLGIAKFSANAGATIFSRDYDPLSDYRAITSLSVDSAGAIYTSQLARDFVSPETLFTVFSRFDGAGDQTWNVSKPGNYPLIMTDTKGNWYTVALNPESKTEATKYDANAALIWDSTAPIVVPHVGCISKAGAVVIAASFNGDVARFAADGTSSWTTSGVSGTRLGQGNAVATDNSENVYVGGRSGQISETSGLIRYDSAGLYRWFQSEPGSAPSNGFEYYQSIVVDPLSRIVTVSGVNNVVTGSDIRVACYDTQGNRIWSNDIDTAHPRDVPDGAVTDGSGNTYVTGHSGQLSVSKFATNGSVQWLHAFKGSNLSSKMLPPQLAPGGGIVAAQLGTGAVYRYDPSGNLLWRYSNFASTDSVVAFKVLSNGSVDVLLGHTPDQNGDAVAEIRIVKLNSSGAFVSAFEEPAGLMGAANSFALDSAGNFYVTYSTAAETAFIRRFGLAKFSAAGTYQWGVSTGNPSIVTQPSEVVVDSGGNPIITFLWENPQDLQNFEANFEAWVSKYSPSGAVLFSTQAFSEGTPFSLWHPTLDANDNLFLTAYVYNPNKTQYGEIEVINPAGGKRWSSIFSSLEGRVAQVIPDNAGGATIGATVATTTGEDYEVVKFADGGTRVWVNGGLYSNGRIYIDFAGLRNRLGALTKDAIGNLYLTGFAWGTSNSFDFNVIKFNALDSRFDSLGMATSMTSRQTYPVTVRFTNTGTETWSSAGGYRMLLTDGSATWGINSASLAAPVVGGAQGTLTFNVTAPTTPGTYTLSTKMYRSGFGSFGQTATHASIVVVPAADDATFVSVTAPSQVRPYQHFQVTVDVKNNGSNTWTKAGGYVMVPTTRFPTWGNPSVSLASSDSISFGQHKIFTLNCIAPGPSGTYQMIWQMKRGTTFFGDLSIAKTITVVQ